MTVHAVAAISPGKIIARETSCHCKECFRNGIYNPESPCGWKVHLLKECSNTAVKPVAEDWVAAVYDRKWYVGKVLEADPIDNDALITMQSTTKKVGFSEVASSSRSSLGRLWVYPGHNRTSFPLWKNTAAVQVETVAMIEGLFAKYQANKELN